MIFNSVEFFIFLAATYWLYRILPFRGQNWMLLIASYIFYGWWDQRFLFLIVLSTALDFCCGLMIDKGRLKLVERSLASISTLLAAFFFVTVQWNAVDISGNNLGISVDWAKLFPGSASGWLVLMGTLGVVAIANLLYPRLAAIKDNQRRKIFLVISIVSNLGILGVFKYFNFFIESAETVISSLNLQAELLRLNVILPVGISFYTFQTMSYTIDIYRGQMKATNRFFDFALFVSFFPQLVAGPIERASELLPRLLNSRTLNFQQSMRGVFLILFGLFKKVAIADSIAGSVNAVYETSGVVSWLDVVLATVLFTIQIYCDFSGYSDIARGTAKLLGIELMTNFNLPYFSQSPSEFWRRWHISLSTWLRDYLYIPLGGNRKGEFRTYGNLMTTMVLGGLWHGAGWNFVLWGFYHGSLLCVYRALSFKSINSAQTAAIKPQFATVKTTNIFFTQIIPFIYFKISKLGYAVNIISKKIPFLATIFFFLLTLYGWLLFRANSWHQIITFTTVIFRDFGNFSLTMPKPTLAGLLGIPILIIYEILEYNAASKHFYLRFPEIIRGAFYAIMTIMIIMGMSNEPAQFIYFQF